MNMYHSEQPRKPSHKLHVKIENIDNVLCEVYLPKKSIDTIELRFYPENRLLCFPWKFSIHGEAKGFDGNTKLEVEARNVYLKDDQQISWSKDIVDRIVIGAPTDLRVTEFLSDAPDASQDRTIRGYFKIAPSEILFDLKRRVTSYAGKVNVERLQEFKVTIEDGVSLVFDQYFEHEIDSHNNMVSFPELVAKFEVSADTFARISNFESIDDLMMLLSFIARQRCVCTGWVTSELRKVATFYRRDVTIPQMSQRHDYFRSLIEKQDWNEFVSTAYLKLNEMDGQNRRLIRRIINGALSSSEQIWEASFLALYSAIESLCKLFVRKCRHSERSIAQQMGKDIGSRVRVMAEYYDVDLKDLWPISNEAEYKGNLKLIRDALVHGDTHDAFEGLDLIVAREHLRWTLERLAISVLGWPVARSHVSREFLSSYMACYTDWQKTKG